MYTKSNFYTSHVGRCKQGKTEFEKPEQGLNKWDNHNMNEKFNLWVDKESSILDTLYRVNY